MNLPPELAKAQQALWALSASGFTGSAVVHFKDGKPLSVEERKTTRLTGETDLSRQSQPDYQKTAETHARPPANAGDSNVRHSNRG